MSIYQILHADLSIARAGERYDTKTQAKPGMGDEVGDFSDGIS